MPWTYADDPFYRALLAEVADLEWQIAETDFEELDAAAKSALWSPPARDGAGSGKA